MVTERSRGRSEHSIELVGHLEGGLGVVTTLDNSRCLVYVGKDIGLAGGNGHSLEEKIVLLLAALVVHLDSVSLDVGHFGRDDFSQAGSRYSDTVV
jgi:hypothetical protein